MTNKRPRKVRARRSAMRRPNRKTSSAVCVVPECGRPIYARKVCQTHHRQLLTRGELQPIRPYRRRSEGTVKFAGLRLTGECVEKLKQRAEEKRISSGAAIAEVLEWWCRRKP